MLFHSMPKRAFQNFQNFSHQACHESCSGVYRGVPSKSLSSSGLMPQYFSGTSDVLLGLSLATPKATGLFSLF